MKFKKSAPYHPKQLEGTTKTAQILTSYEAYTETLSEELDWGELTGQEIVDHGPVPEGVDCWYIITDKVKLPSGN